MRKQYTLAPNQEDHGESMGAIEAQELNNRFKILFLGNERTGKSSLITRFLSNEFEPDYNETRGLELKSDTLFLGGRITKLKIWDASGQEMFRSSYPEYIRSADVIVLVYDVTNKDSFEAIEDWIALIEKERSLAEVILVYAGAKADLEPEKLVDRQEGKETAAKRGAIFLETSAKTGENCKELFHTIARKLAPAEVADQKETSDLLEELDGLEDEYYAESSEKSFCQKLCCCLSAFFGSSSSNRSDAEFEVINTPEHLKKNTEPDQHQVYVIDGEDPGQDDDLEGDLDL